jgi:hypothetical protein
VAQYSAERFLVALSTSRVLNLTKTARKNHLDPDYRLRPIFISPALNSAFILKQSVRQNELYNIDPSRAQITKIICPFDANDLLAGGRAIIIGERGFEETIYSMGQYKADAGQRDLEVLRLLDAPPSLDPFLCASIFQTTRSMSRHVTSSSPKMTK